jgi:hypothetical protein
LAVRANKDVYDLMNGPIYDKLSATLPYLNPWDAQGDAVFDANWVDFMKPVITQGTPHFEPLIEHSSLI